MGLSPVDAGKDSLLSTLNQMDSTKPHPHQLPKSLLYKNQEAVEEMLRGLWMQ